MRLNASDSFDDFVKFTPVEPNTSALGAIVDFDPVSLRQEQIYVTYRTSHVHYLLRIVVLKTFRKLLVKGRSFHFHPDPLFSRAEIQLMKKPLAKTIVVTANL